MKDFCLSGCRWCDLFILYTREEIVVPTHAISGNASLIWIINKLSFLLLLCFRYNWVLFDEQFLGEISLKIGESVLNNPPDFGVIPVRFLPLREQLSSYPNWRKRFTESVDCGTLRTISHWHFSSINNSNIVLFARLNRMLSVRMSQTETWTWEYR